MAHTPPIYSPYGAYELKAKYQRNMALGTGFVIALVAIVLGVAAAISAMGEEDYSNVPEVVIKSVKELGPPPSVAKKPPQVQVSKPDVAKPKVGIPKPVADEEVIDDDVVLATREELAEIVAPDVSSSAGDGDIRIDISDDDFLPEPDEFVPVEIQPEMIKETTPEYPRLAKQAGLEGTVWVKALVDEKGDVLKAIVAKTSGTVSLDEAAVETAYDNKFKPGIQNGRPIKCWVTYRVDFVLSSN